MDAARYDLYEQSPPVSEGLTPELYNQTFNPKADAKPSEDDRQGKS